MIQGIGSQGVLPKHEQLKGTNKQAKESNPELKESQTNDQQDSYVKAIPTEVTAGTYDRPKGVDTEGIERLKGESEKAFQQLKNIVKQMLERQGMEFQEIFGENVTVEIDDQAVKEAQALIDEDGPYSPEAVSDRIVDAAKAFSGGDKNKLGLMRGAIEAGFKAAAGMFGGKLPEISYKTYDLIVEKLDAWENEE